MAVIERTLIKDTPEKIDQEVRLCGFINSWRDHGNIVFLDLRDKSGLIQVIGDNSIDDIRSEHVVEIVGKVKKRSEKMINPKIPIGEIEIELKEIKVLSKAEELPFDMGVDKLSVSFQPFWIIVR